MKAKCDDKIQMSYLNIVAIFYAVSTQYHTIVHNVDSKIANITTYYRLT